MNQSINYYRLLRNECNIKMEKNVHKQHTKKKKIYAYK